MFLMTVGRGSYNGDTWAAVRDPAVAGAVGDLVGRRLAAGIGAFHFEVPDSTQVCLAYYYGGSIIISKFINSF